ncbi:MAG: acetylglutamate kinase [Muribaculaceae bacterium]|nr:acetylglutamate kinase [Muribaculaceae bacterium]
MKSKLTVVKVGGAVAEDPQALDEMLDAFVAIEGDKILVHGGGRSATTLARRLGIEVNMIDGRRVTDRAMLEVVIMTYGGWVNKNIVAALQSRGVNALGLTGADMSIIRAVRRAATPIDYGYVGDVREVNGTALKSLLDVEVTPVVAPLSYDGEGGILNTNADTIASEVACAMSREYDVTLIYCFELAGVMRDPDDADSLIPDITPGSYAELKEQGVISGGMIPKLDNAFSSLSRGVSRVVITRADSLTGGGTHIHL